MSTSSLCWSLGGNWLRFFSGQTYWSEIIDNDYHPEHNANIQEIQKNCPGQWIQTQSLDIIWLNGIQRLSLQLLHLWGYYSLCLSFGHFLRISNQGILLQVILLSPFPRRQDHISCAIMPPMLIPMMCTFCHFKSSKTAKASCAIRWVVQRISPWGYPEYPVPRLSTAQTCGTKAMFLCQRWPHHLPILKLSSSYLILKFPKNPLGWILKRHIFSFFLGDWFWEFF